MRAEGRRRLVALTLCLLFTGLYAFGQAGTGTITGVVTDAQGAVVAGASIEVKSVANGQVYTGASSATGNYSITQLPPGEYELTVKSQGFKTYNHKNIQVEVAQVLRQDAPLEVGATGETVTVTAEATLLRTETGDLATNITVDSLDNLPILGIGTTNSGSSGLRNPYNMLQLIPGVGSYVANSAMVFDGTPVNSEAMRIEGQDMTNHLVSFAVQEGQPSADAIQEVAVQTSNYAPEFGTTGSVILNMTMKSGTNQFHGSVYDYFVNEDLNAGYPYSISGGPGSLAGGDGGKYRPRNRRNDYGGTIGGPVWIPKVYNGHNKTFFFFNLERYIESNEYSFPLTVPQPSFIKGDFSAISPNGTCSLCSTYGIPTGALGSPTKAVDPQGRNLFANTIYDPLTRAVNPANNLGYANPFQGNTIPSTRFDPVALKLEALFPAATNNNLTGDATGSILGHRISLIPSFKIDESATAKDKFSFYYQKTGTEAAIAYPNGNADGLPQEIGAYRGTYIYTWIYRLNYDRTINPTLLLHLGAGYYRENFGDEAPFHSFNPSQFGLSGFEINRQFPFVSGITAAGTNGSQNFGGMQNIGTVGQIQTFNRQTKPSFNVNITKVSGSHTYKAGGEVYYQGTLFTTYAGVFLNAGINATTQPYVNTTNLNGYGTGLGYAGFLLGDYNSTQQNPQLDYRLGKAQYAFFAQDSWKVTRKLTLDYGIRYDLATPPEETYGRLGQFAPTLANASAGGHPGATIYASNCGCSFYQSVYPYGIGPRIGAAYQLNSKTVLRAGWGVVYQYAGDGSAGSTVSSSAVNSLPGINTFVNTQSPGFILQPTWPVTNPNIYPTILGTTSSAPTVADKNINRPPRQNQWSVGIQREITRNLVAEASYVGNRDVWLPGPLGFTNQVSPAQYASYGLYPYPGTGPAGYNNYADYLLLSQPVSSTAVEQRMAARGVGNGGLLLPYATASPTISLGNAITTFPQFSTSRGFGPSGSATGISRYDSLQAKVTKRFSRGLQASGAFTWEKGFTEPGRQDFFNPASSVWALQNLPPMVLTFNFTYTTPKAAYFDSHAKFVNQIIKDWQIGGFANYQSGSFLAPPTNPTSNFLSSEENRVQGASLYLKPINGQINPYYDQVLNPAAWTEVGTNAVGASTSVLYPDFRGPRHPTENANIARNFRIKERLVLQFRGEFVNIFNRVEMPNPSAGPAGFGGGTIPQNPLTKNGFGYLTGGFGTINAYATPNSAPGGFVLPRSGTLVMRLTF